MAIAKLSIDIEARLANFEQQLEKVARQAEGMAGRVKSSFSTLGATVGVALGALVTAGAVGQFKTLVDSLDQLDEAAERIGSSASDLSALAYAAKLNGVEFEELNKGLVKFSGLLADAAAGNKEAVETLNKLGVSSDNYDDLNAAVGQAADRFAGMKDGVGKTALAVDAFGEKLGVKMVPLLNQGAGGIEALRKEAVQLGGVIDDKLAKQAADFNDNLDRLSTYAGVAGKSLAGGLLPWLNEVAESFLISRKNAESFWEAINRPIPGTGFVDVEANLRRVQHEFEQIGFRLSNDRGKDGDAERFAKLERELNYWTQIKEARDRTDNPPPKPSGGGGDSDSKKTKTSKARPDRATSFTDYDAMLVERIGNAINAIDQVKADELAAALVKLDQLAAAGLDPAIVKAVRDDLTGASKAAADELARLNKLLGETESAKIKSAQEDMQLLAGALETARISEEQYLEAVQARLGKGSEEIAKQKSLAEELGLTFTSAFEDAVAEGAKFSDVLKGLEQDILRLITRMTITEPLGKAVQGFDWGSLASGVAGWFSGGTTANANGNVYASPSLSAYSGGVYDTPRFFKFAAGAGVFGEAGPEAIMPLKRGKDGKLGVAAEGGGASVTVNVINNTDAQARSERRSDGSGGTIIDVFIEQAKNAVAGDIARGSGAVPAALQGAYGLKRTAGAY